MNDRLKILSNFKWFGSLTLIQAVIGTFVFVVLVRILPSEDFGLMAIASILIMFSNIIGDAGLGQAVIQSKELNENKMSSVFWSNILIGCLLTLGICFSGHYIAILYEDNRLVSLSYWLSGIILAQSLFELETTLMKKHLAYDVLAKYLFVAFIVGSFLKMFLAWSGFGVMSLVWGELARTITVGLIILLFQSNKFIPKFYFNITEIKSLFVFGGFQSMEKIAGYFTSHIDIILLGKLIGVEALGIYEIVKKLLIRPHKMLGSVLSGIGYSVFSKFKEDDQVSIDYLYKNLNLVAHVLFPAYLFVHFNSLELIEILFAEKSDEYLPLFKSFSFLFCIYGLRQFHPSIMASRNKVIISFVVKVITLGLYVIAIFSGYSSLSLSSVVNLYTVFTLVMVCVELAVIKIKVLNFEFWTYVKLTAIPFVLFLALGGFVAYVSSTLFQLSSLSSLILSGTLYGGIYILYLIYVEKNLIQDLRKMISS